MDGIGRARVLGMTVLVVCSVRTFPATFTLATSARATERYTTACGCLGLSSWKHHV